MKRRMLAACVLVAILIVASASVPVAADSPSKITGGVDFPMQIYTGEIVTSSAMFSIQEVNPETHEARGNYRWWVKQDGVADHLTVDVTCVIFSETDPTEATFGGRVTRLTNWPEQMQCLQYALVHVRDGGTPGSAGDAIAFSFGDCQPGYTCDPGCDLCDPDPKDCPCPTVHTTDWIPVTAGNLVIHR